MTTHSNPRLFQNPPLPAARPAPEAPRHEPVWWFACGALCGAGVIPGLVWALTGAMFGWATLTALGAYGGGVVLAGWALHSHYPHRSLGLCNVVTLLRWALTAALVGALAHGTPNAGALLIIATLALAFDGVDGWLARRAGLDSSFGARFDVEVDSAFALILAALAVQSGLHPLVLALGMPRYAFGVAQWMEPRLNGPLTPRFSRKVVCVVQIAVLILLTMPWLDPGLRHGLATGCAALVAWSFAVDIRALLKAAR